VLEVRGPNIALTPCGKGGGNGGSSDFLRQVRRQRGKGKIPRLRASRKKKKKKEREEKKGGRPPPSEEKNGSGKTRPWRGREKGRALYDPHAIRGKKRREKEWFYPPMVFRGAAFTTTGKPVKAPLSLFEKKPSFTFPEGRGKKWV